ncbi:uncharacterized protein BT62DRAFT_576811 [Guyanagaster necrorhizus]|uniref:Uncharacterized protein n=1 Tax=Guyanagaster necrorhizus TaxID=856835 RepID=A0A9P7VHD0_9AGAR|nr:uncharacterized protein BT62DRAFT_576811 [Guyanagaster necrorhizus MCA 3950]KAG7440575.1 hypothetical protein BT62DRAFT_576811 [Guyanagaster necrorhizus MCA 3950]
MRENTGLRPWKDVVVVVVVILLQIRAHSILILIDKNQPSELRKGRELGGRIASRCTWDLSVYPFPLDQPRVQRTTIGS